MWGKSIIAGRTADITLISLLPSPEGRRFNKETHSLLFSFPSLAIKAPGCLLPSLPLITSHRKAVPADDPQPVHSFPML